MHELEFVILCIKKLFVNSYVTNAVVCFTFDWFDPVLRSSPPPLLSLFATNFYEYKQLLSERKNVKKKQMKQIGDFVREKKNTNFPLCVGVSIFV